MGILVFDNAIDEISAKYGYQKIMFERHKFPTVYRMQNDQVNVDGMFHELQDYDGILVRELYLN